MILIFFVEYILLVQNYLLIKYFQQA